MYEHKRNDGKLLNSIETVCDRLEIGRTSLYALIKAGDLKLIKIGSKSLITEESILAYVDRLITAPAKEAA